MPKPSASAGNDPLLVKLGVINVSALMSESVTYPLDFIKTRMQAHTGANRLNPFTTAAAVVREEGLSSLYRGLPAAVLRHWVYTAARIQLYESFRNESDARGWGIAGKIVSGASAGGLGQLIASPTDLVKVRMQVDRNIGKSAKYRSVPHCIKTIYAEEGLLAFYKGWSPNMQRAILVNLGELATYDVSKHALLKYTPLQDNVFCHAAASIVSGFFSTVCSCPADVVKTRLMQAGATGMPTMSTIACAQSIIKNEGFRSLYKGFFPTWARLGPWQFVFWVSYEQGRKVAGMSSF